MKRGATEELQNVYTPLKVRKMSDNTLEHKARLICIDFDKTIINGHSHIYIINKCHFYPRIDADGVQASHQSEFINIITNEVTKDFSINNAGEKLNEEKITQILKCEKLKGLKNSAQMYNCIKHALRNGHHVAITSFTLFPEVIRPALKMLRSSDGDRLTEDEINEIYVVGGFPKDGSNSDEAKQEHIKQSMSHFGMSYDNYDERLLVMLIDDSKKNIYKAIKCGFATQQVPDSINPDPQTYFPAIENFVGIEPEMDLSLHTADGVSIRLG